MARGPYWTSSGAGWRLAYSLVQLADEIDKRWPDGSVPNKISQRYLGTRGDDTHSTQAGYSDHNTVVRAPDGLLLCRAIDVNLGTPELNRQLATIVWKLYNVKFPPLWSKGYAHEDGRINPWDDDPDTVSVPDDGDWGHVHISVTQKTYPSIAAGYLPAVDSRATWGVWPIVKPTPPPLELVTDMENDMFVTFNDDPNASGVHFLVTGGGLVWLGSKSWQAVIDSYGGKTPPVSDQPLTSQIYKLPIFPGTTDPRD